MVPSQRFEEVPGLIGGERSTFLTDHLWRPGKSGDIAMDEFLPDRLIQALGEHGSNSAHRGAR